MATGYLSPPRTPFRHAANSFPWSSFGSRCCWRESRTGSSRRFPISVPTGAPCSPSDRPTPNGSGARTTAGRTPTPGNCTRCRSRLPGAHSGVPGRAPRLSKRGQLPSTRTAPGWVPVRGEGARGQARAGQDQLGRSSKPNSAVWLLSSTINSASTCSHACGGMRVGAMLRWRQLLFLALSRGTTRRFGRIVPVTDFLG